MEGMLAKLNENLELHLTETGHVRTMSHEPPAPMLLHFLAHTNVESDDPPEIIGLLGK